MARDIVLLVITAIVAATPSFAHARAVDSTGEANLRLQHLEATINLVANNQLTDGSEALTRELQSMNAHLETPEGKPISANDVKTALAVIVVLESPSGEIIDHQIFPNRTAGERYMEHEIDQTPDMAPLLSIHTVQ